MRLPIEILSTPVSAISLTFERSIPPEASRIARFALSATACFSKAVSKLSSRINVAPAFKALSNSAMFSTSI